VRLHIELSTLAIDDINRHCGTGLRQKVGRRMALLWLSYVFSQHASRPIRHLYGPWYHLADGGYSVLFRELDFLELTGLMTRAQIGVLVSQILTPPELVVYVKKMILDQSQ
jgi:hypothetical protein